MKKNYDIIVFDLDGTITASDLGITNSIKYALNYFGLEKDNESLKRHIWRRWRNPKRNKK